MKKAFQILYKNKTVLVLLLTFFISGISLIYSTNKYALHKEINKHYTSFFDYFFSNITHLGDGISFLLLVILLIIIRRDWATSFIIAAISTLIISFLLKHILYNVYRPHSILKDQIRYIEGVVMKQNHSFPSGHTTAVFTMGILGILYIKKYWAQVIILVVIILVGLSRVYLSQHYLNDVIGGAFIGIIIAVISYALGNRYDFFKKKPTN